MRITKVAVEPTVKPADIGTKKLIKIGEPKQEPKKQMVLIYRTSTQAKLVYENDVNSTCRTREVLPTLKEQSYHMSVVNKSLVKETKENETLRTAIKNILSNVLKGKHSITDKTEEEINACLSDKIKHKIPTLAQLLISGNLALYKTWAENHIDEKSKATIDSITNNKIQLYTDTPASPNHRQKALAHWAAMTDTELKNSIEDIEGLYKLTELVTKPVTEPTPPATFSSILTAQKAHDTEECKKEKKDRKYYPLHRTLKKTLQIHQKTLFGSKKENEPYKANRANHLLQTYSQELVKYLEHYFPVTKSERKSTLKGEEKANEIKYYLTQGVIAHRIRYQLQNAIRLRKLDQGKQCNYELTTADTNTPKLVQIRAQEAFVANMLDCIAFATSNIRNIVNKDETGDILTKADFKTTLTANKIDADKYKLFYGTLPTDPDKPTKNLWAMRGAVQKMRNNIIHYKKKALNTIFDIDDFEYCTCTPVPTAKCTCSNTQYTDTIYKCLLANEIANLEALFADKLKTAGILSYYTEAQVTALLKQLTFNLCHAAVPFAPGFKRVFAQGCNYQESTSTPKYDLKLNHYNSKANKESKEGATGDNEAYEARRTLLKILYNDLFLAQFTTNDKLFIAAEKDVRSYNKKHSIDNNKAANRKAQAQAFGEIRRMDDTETPGQYMAYLQSQLIHEDDRKEGKKQETGPRKGEDKPRNAEKLMIQLFIKGFDSFLTSLSSAVIAGYDPQSQQSPLAADWLHSTTKQLTETSPAANTAKLNALTKKIEQNIKLADNDICPCKPSHIAFYTLCKLLDATQLNTLRHELLKYRHSLADTATSTNTTNTWELPHILAIVELCMLSTATNTDSHCGQRPAISQEAANKDTANQALIDAVKPFVEDGANLECWGELFYQADKTTPVPHAGIAKASKYGTLALLQAVIKKTPEFKIRYQEDYRAYDNQKARIEDKQKERQKLHKKWVEDKKLSPQEVTEYKQLCTYIDSYDWLHNKLHLEHVSKLHLLLIDLLARMAGYVAKWDRDFQFFDRSYTSDTYYFKEVISFHEFFNKETWLGVATLGELAKEAIGKRDGTEPNWATEEKGIEKELREKRKRYVEHIFKHNTKPFETRNHIAHFNYISTGASKSLLELIAELRNLLAYDRKLKNAVTKSIIKLFDKHGMLLKLTIDHGTQAITVACVTPKPVYHLGTKETSEKPISTNEVSPLFCAMCEALLEYKKTK